ncbi:MAG: aminoacyl-tRNA hydrolase [Phycisphaerae bacterium]|nr:aminoacyl-tRNA hydrolase [Phycisphaerae bacterium]
MDSLFINQKLCIPESLLTFTFSRSSGPGGQNVNKLNTRVCVSLDIMNCPCLTDAQKRKITRMLEGRIDKRGILQVVCQEYRSQHANRNAAIQRLVELIAEALKPVKVRRATKLPNRAIEKRLREKKQRSLQKKQRSDMSTDE